MIDPHAPNSTDDAVGPVVESFLARFRRGERPGLTELVALHPNLADQLLEIIPALVELEQLGGSTGPFAGPRPGGLGAVEGDHPESLGDYRILGRIGGGGMGVVYEAERESLKCRVALKVMHPRFRADAKYLRRFHVEARAAAGLHHTNIVSVFDYGEQGGVCYYAMQYIHGQPLDSVLDDLRRLRADGPPQARPIAPGLPGFAASPTAPAPPSAARGLLTGRFPPGGSPDASTVETGTFAATPDPPSSTRPDPAGGEPEDPREPPTFGSSGLGDPVEGRYYREVARVCAQVAEALDHAHRAGVLHRDIKPSNLLLDALGNVWVTDFGLAKLEGGDDLSQSRDLVGTLRYMAPERFGGVSGRAGDVYALGATLYELATLRPAFDEADQVRLMDRIAHDPPERPRLIDRNVPRDLETIVLKALAKEPKDRFGSARELAEELRKFVAGHPIRSRPISPAERSYRWCRRNPWLAAASVSAASLTIALAIGSTIAAKVFRDGQERYKVVARDAREKLFDARASQARASRFGRQVGQRFETLEALSEAVKIGRDLGYPAEKFDRLRDEAIAALMLPDLTPAGPPIPMPEIDNGFTFDDRMTRYAFRHLDGTVVVRRMGDDREIDRFTARGDRGIWLFILSPDGRYLATRDGDAVSVRDVDRKSLAWTVPVVASFVARFSPDSRRIAVSPRYGTILMHDLATGQSRPWGGPAEEVRCMAFRPDGAEIAVNTQSDRGTCRILDAETGRELRKISLPSAQAVAWSPDGSTLAIAGVHEIQLFNAATGERGARLELSPIAGSPSLAFHPAGMLLSGNGLGTQVWDPSSGRTRLSLTSHVFPAFSKDGRTFLRQGHKG